MAYDNNEENIIKYGNLYNWETAKEVCPEGMKLFPELPSLFPGI
jgi:uncharacterized protein (TIGR02145 family)